MTPGYIYEQGANDYNEGIPLSGNPYNPALSMVAHEAWKMAGSMRAGRGAGARGALETAARTIC